MDVGRAARDALPILEPIQSVVGTLIATLFSETTPRGAGALRPVCGGSTPLDDTANRRFVLVNLFSALG